MIEPTVPRGLLGVNMRHRNFDTYLIVGFTFSGRILSFSDYAVDDAIALYLCIYELMN